MNYTLKIGCHDIPIVFDRDNEINIESMMKRDDEFAEKVGSEIAKLIIRLIHEATRLDDYPFKDIPNPLENEFQWP